MSLFVAMMVAAAPVQAGDIVVTGKADTPEQERKEIRDYIRKTGVAKGETPTARWTEPVCPKVYGVPGPIAERIVARVRAVAQAADIQVAKPRCAPNIAIAFVDNGAGFAKTIQKKSRRHIVSMSLQDKEELFASDAPIRWWYGIGETDRDGSPGGSALAAESGISAIASVAGDAPTFAGNVPPSLISTRTIRVISTATVVIDVKRAEGTPLDAVADYAAFVALAEIDPPKQAPPQSILTLFAGGADGLTDRDRDLLAAVYKIPLAREAYQQRGRLTGKMVEAARN